jgi:hypothetical protein
MFEDDQTQLRYEFGGAWLKFNKKGFPPFELGFAFVVFAASKTGREDGREHLQFRWTTKEGGA